MNEKDTNRIELSALLDGEVGDVGRIEELGALLKDDPGLASEFEEQRSVKSLLAALPEYDAPDFLSTRVMGEIAERSASRRPVSLWRNLGLVATGFALCLAVVAVVYQVNSGPQMPTTTNLARGQNAELAGTPVLDPGQEFLFWMNDGHEPQMASPMLVSGDTYMTGSPHAEGVDDERIQEFLNLAMKAHSYRILVTTAEDASPDMTGAIMMLDQGGGR